MITNIFHSNLNILGIQIERSRTGNSFEMHIALIEGDKWVCKKLGGISGDLDDNTLVEKIIKKGKPLSEEEANNYFVHSHYQYKYSKEE